MNAIDMTVSKANATTTAPYKVAPFSGGSRGDVSAQWFSRPADQRYTSLDELFAAVKARHDRSFEQRLETSNVELFAPEAKTKEDFKHLWLGLPGGREVAPTHYAFGQVCQLAGAPASYLRTLPSQIVTEPLNYGLRFNRSIDQIKLYGGALERGGSPELWAATGPDYGRIPDFDVVDAVRQIAGSGRGERRWKIPGCIDWATHMYDPEARVTKDSTTLYASDRDVFMFLCDDRNPIEIGKLPDGSPDLVFRGFYIQNSEVGSKALKLAAFYLRAVCQNRCLWGVEGFEEISIRHTRLAPERWLAQAQPALQSYAEGSTQKLLAGVEAAREAKVGNDDAEVIQFLQARGHSKPFAKRVLEIHEAEEKRPARSVWDVAMGITAAARTKPNTDDRLQLETEAGKLLDKVARA